MRWFGAPTAAIDWLEYPAFAGRIGMTRCPGLWTRPSALAEDIAAIRAEGATALVSLTELEELRVLGLDTLAEAATRRRLTWYHLPIRDFDVPDAAFEAKWRKVGPELRERLAAGESIVVHCYAGLGRTGLVVARLLVEFGEEPARAIGWVRRVRPGAIQTLEQESHVLGLRPKTGG
jgi:ADP-ribosyl-[dinitrogen reductase] hydrolase